ncbi:MAG: hypothetical protein ACK4KV_19600 [Rhodocyclaceae bacterium]
MIAGMGFELGRFRLKPGVTEADLLAASAAMEAAHLNAQPGFVARALVRLDEGVYLDVVHARGRADAERICASWIGQPDCERFLALIEADSIAFGTVL